MKPFLITSSLLVVVLNGLLMVPALHEHAMPLGASATGLAVLTLGLAIASGGKSASPATPTAPPAAAPPPAPPANQAEAEVIAFFGLLQEKGRFVDFLMEDITPFDDAQVAAASRVVHQGCKAVLNEHFDITPVAEGSEGASFTVPAGYPADQFRLLGKISGEAPFTGTLVHKGWKTTGVKLPRILKSNEDHLPAIAPAEVELK
ncbi:DUF2760 domain-containing protein [Haloferula sp.]|uniref:DUF2760 domain-containing protein n=1 Tax=Haloferula sp. TaxID=2497595 RepID=UPI003C7941B4